MNLLADRWLPVVRLDGTHETIAIGDLLSEYGSNPVIDLEAPRPDFYNALYQLLIGIVQVAAAPEDEEDWAELWHEPYAAEEFKKKLLRHRDCFEIGFDGPAFMQDYDWEYLLSQRHDSIYRLLMGSPGENTVKLGKDLFMKEKDWYGIDAYWAAIALFVTQQVAEPPDGGGHREGLRGSGALCTLIRPVGHDREATAWERVWANVFPQEEVACWNGNPDMTMFPWMAETKPSTGNVRTGFDDLHPLSVYWSTSWRARLASPSTEGICSLTGIRSQHLVTHYCRHKHGYMYSYLWEHPFTPVQSRIPPDSEKTNRKPTMRATPDRFLYTNWSVLSLYGDAGEFLPSRIVRYFFGPRESFVRAMPFSFRLWVSGFHMVPGEATVKNWNEATMPLVLIPQQFERAFRERCEVFVSQATELAKQLREATKRAWFGSPKKGDKRIGADATAFLGNAFWQNTERAFYQIVDEMADHVDDAEVWAKSAEKWRDRIIEETRDLFDRWALAQQQDGLNMRRVVDARNYLETIISKVRENFTNTIEVK